MSGWTPKHTRVLAEAASKSAHQAPVPRRMAVRTSPLPGRGEGPYRTVNRDRVIQASSAPPGARQQWELYRVREESRDLEHRGAVWKAYVRFVRIQALGGDVSRIHYEHEEADKARLADVVKRIRRDWMAWQRIRNLGGTGQTIHQMAGSVLHHTLVDGDCFITRRRAERGPVFDLHPGDSLAETSYSREARADGLMRQLGVEVDKHLRPMAFYFGDGGYMSRQLWGFHSYAGTSIEEKRIDAARVLHLRDRSGEVTAVRGWPLCTGVIEEIARLEEWYGALVRSATLRAAIGIALEKDPLLGSVGDLGGGLAPSDMNVHAVGSDEYDPNARTYGEQDVRPYQEFAIRGGTLMELLAGYKPHRIDTGAPTSQEAQAIGMLERRVCAGLRVTAATLLGDYAALSFSGGQLSHQQERQGIEDHQALLTDQFYPHVFTEFLMARWLGLRRRVRLEAGRGSEAAAVSAVLAQEISDRRSATTRAPDAQGIRRRHPHVCRTSGRTWLCGREPRGSHPGMAGESPRPWVAGIPGSPQPDPGPGDDGAPNNPDKEDDDGEDE